MHAVSRDLLNWEKVPCDMFYAPAEIYEPDDWRDPFVFWNKEENEFWMLLAARMKEGPTRRRGCTALSTSKDLEHWVVREPLYAPGLYYTHECPDLFKMGDWWYLIFSEFSECFITRYRMSRSLSGPWIIPEEDSFDGRAYYAAKTYSDGRRRYLFGWNATREGDRDYQTWQWGGNLVVHEIIQNEEGLLQVKAPDTVIKAFDKRLPVNITVGLGKWRIDGNCLRNDAYGAFACALAGDMPDCCSITADIGFDEKTKGCGIMLRADKDLEHMYYIRLEPFRNRLVFDMWPRDGDKPFMVELERSMKLIPGKRYKIKVFVEDTLCEVYVGNSIAMSARLYNLKKGQWGVFVNDGIVDFKDVCCSIR